ncbi:MAG: TlpA family protein disulfide reductase, partial [Ruminococcus sp.]|nr:TlpA family protein disulfide reductase [Ruminococcus sp.]
MKTTKILILLTALMMLLSFAACGTDKGNTTNTTANKKSETAMLTAVNPKTKDEAADLHQKLMAQENAILSENSELWEKVFISADKG